MKSIILRLLTAGLRTQRSRQADAPSLADALAKVDHVFGCDPLLKEFDADFTVPYYTQSEIGYRFYHSSVDAVHMALNFDGVFRPEGYRAQPQIVAGYLDGVGVHQVLEVGCGKGFNSLLLARQYPNVQFTGIDLTPSHIAIARRNGKGLPNLLFKTGDFNRLDLPPQSYDLVFACESLCHARQSQRVLAELFRILRPGGTLIVFDGYRKAELADFTGEMQTATQLVEIGMAVQQGFHPLAEWTESARRLGFAVEACEDLTLAVQPTLDRLQSAALMFFRSGLRARLFKALLPKYLVRNAVPGLLMPFAFAPAEGALGYYQLVLTRHQETPSPATSV